ncbi:hypothetical protein Lalb_Chr15g0080621 [Lupinus albus]|uniref:Uncharacterized protein n=1 Tax=Lupinus albus TaxID=3870 RepID=A0A6A4PDF5_LUPAL|nr:hypothetical protein Lalb_Chr15g0080621 [Lupinus albus]
MVHNRKRWKVWSVVWLATIWALWLTKNDIIFNNVTTFSHKILDSAKVKAWLWTRSMHGKESTSYAERVANPFDCLNIIM